MVLSGHLEKIRVRARVLITLYLLSFVKGHVVQAKLGISFFILFFTCASVFAGEFDAKTVHKAMERAKEYEKMINLPDIDNSIAQKAAKEAAHQFYAADFQQKITAEIERLKIEQFADILTKQKKTEQKKAKSALLTSERLYIFIS